MRSASVNYSYLCYFIPAYAYYLGFFVYATLLVGSADVLTSVFFFLFRAQALYYFWFLLGILFIFFFMYRVTLLNTTLGLVQLLLRVSMLVGILLSFSGLVSFFKVYNLTHLDYTGVCIGVFISLVVFVCAVKISKHLKFRAFRLLNLWHFSKPFIISFLGNAPSGITPTPRTLPQFRGSTSYSMGPHAVSCFFFLLLTGALFAAFPALDSETAGVLELAWGAGVLCVAGPGDFTSLRIFDNCVLNSGLGGNSIGIQWQLTADNLANIWHSGASCVGFVSTEYPQLVSLPSQASL